MTVAKALSVWTANDIQYSLRCLIASPPQIFVLAVGPRIADGAQQDVRVSAEPIPQDDLATWLTMLEGSRTAAAESLLGNSLTPESELYQEQHNGRPRRRRRDSNP